MASNLLNQATPLAIIDAKGAVTSPGAASATSTSTNLLDQAKPVVIVGADGKIHTLDGGSSPSLVKAAAVADVATDADAAAIATAFNTLLTNLRTAGILATA